MSKEDKILKTVAARFDGGYNKKLRAKISDIKRETVYHDIINRIGNTMFKWSGLPKEVEKDIDSMWIELSINCGAAVIYKLPETFTSVNRGAWCCTPVEFTGVLKNNGTSDHFITSGTDYCITDTELKDYVIIKNNSYLSCEYDISEWFASMLADTDISERALIRWSRMTPIARANSGAEIGKLREVMQKVYDGSPFEVFSDDTKMITNGSPMSRDDSVLRLNDESAIERMHFLSEFHYELVRRICNLYNMPFHTTAKSAQNLESEVHNTDVFSQALTENRLETRQKGAKELNSVFGWNVSVDVGETIEKENAIIDSNVQQEINEAAENVSRETPAEEAENKNETENETGENND